MNTTTVHIVPLAASPVIEASVQEVANLRAQLQAAEAKLKADQEIAAAAAKEALRAAIASIPAQLGVATIKEAVALMQPLVEPGKFPGRLSSDTLAQMRAMLESGATSRAVAEALKCGISTVDNRKAEWKLTHRGKSGQQARPKRRANNRHLSPEKRAKIIEALTVPNASISALKRRFGVSRQTLTTIRAGLRQLQHAA